MCHRYSWLEKDGDILFLTSEQVFHTKRGKELQKYTENSDDLYGHGAIVWFYDLKTKMDQKECEDFSTPDNFPKVLVEAIKDGKMWEFGITQEMKQLMTSQALKEYEKIAQLALKEYDKIQQSALKEYDKIQQSALKEYEKIAQLALKEYGKIRQLAWKEYEKIQQPALKEYGKIRQLAWKEYEKIQQPALKEYGKIRQLAWKEYEKITQQAFSKLFSNPKNRNPLWK